MPPIYRLDKWHFLHSQCENCSVRVRRHSSWCIFLPISCFLDSRFPPRPSENTCAVLNAGILYICRLGSRQRLSRRKTGDMAYRWHHDCIALACNRSFHFHSLSQRSQLPRLKRLAPSHKLRKGTAQRHASVCCLGFAWCSDSTGQQKAVCIKIPLICVKSFSDMNEHGSLLRFVVRVLTGSF